MKLLVNLSTTGLQTVTLPRRVDMHAAKLQLDNMFPGDAVMIVKELS